MPSHFENCAIVIPALNEAATISSVVADVKRFVSMVIVVDDGSKDGTADLAEKAGATVVTHSWPKGYDEALRSGLKKALQAGMTAALTMDADGQHFATDIPGFLSPIVEGGKDVVFGIRPSRPRAAEKVFCAYAHKRFGIVDPLCGMKAYRLNWVMRFESTFDVPSVGTALALKCVQQGAQFEQVEIRVGERRDISRFGGTLRANYRLFKTLVRTAIDLK